MDALFELLPISITSRLPEGKLCELRLRINRPLYFYDGKIWSFAPDGSERGYIVSKADIDYILGVASGYSVYAISDNLIKGYIPCKGAADRIIKKVILNNAFKNTLIISPTGAGKTTLLREIARLSSEKGLNTLIIDERFELSAPFKGLPTLDVGACADVIAGVPKSIAIEGAVRCMNPDVIITDEIFGENEITAVLSAIAAGVKVAASVHANGADELEKGAYKPLLDAAEVIITLAKTPRVGEIKRVIVK